MSTILLSSCSFSFSYRNHDKAILEISQKYAHENIDPNITITHTGKLLDYEGINYMIDNSMIDEFEYKEDNRVIKRQ